MKKFFIEKEKIDNSRILLDGAEFLHASKVLRTEIGENIVCLCGDEFEYHCTITEITKKFLIAKVNQKVLCLKNPKFNITLFQGAVKGEKLELITQKCTELGISALIPFESQFTIAKKNITKIERLQKISQEACKQCGRSKPMEIFEFVKFKDLENSLKTFDLVLFLYENAPLESTLEKNITQIQKAKSVAIIVGAEGGFSDEENLKLLNLNATPICLGQRILRAETAAITICGFISFLKNN